MARHLLLARFEAAFIRATSILGLTFGLAGLMAAQSGGSGSGGLTPSPKDSGPRGGSASAGGPISGLDSATLNFFNQALLRFKEVDSVSGTILPSEPGSGLGPEFNGNSCAMCHAQPTVGGSSPGLTSPQNPIQNPQVKLATLDGADNTPPAFITASGPVREARFFSDSGVHNLYTIAGRSDAQNCSLNQTDFTPEINAGTISFRIPTPLFGLGLVENVTDDALIANLAAEANAGYSLIKGSFNTSANDGTITRFGWKAQNKSLLIFAGEAYNVEQGVTNENFPNERNDPPASCLLNGTPEDHSLTINQNTSSPNFNTTIGTVSEMSADIVNFAAFSRFSAPPTRVTAVSGSALAASQVTGLNLFSSTGCAVCHTSELNSGQSAFTGMTNVSFHPYSDFALHHMGSSLADGITQGAAGPDQFRTAPLWGAGQRLFFLSDGSETDLLKVIARHATPACASNPTTGCSEASQVIQKFNALTSSQQQSILDFLRTL